MRSYVVLIFVINIFIVSCVPKGRFDYAQAYDDYEYDDNRINRYDRFEPSQRELQDAFSNLPANGEPFEGDIIMDERLREAVLGQNKKSAVVRPDAKWPGGVLYYTVNKNFFNPKLLKKAMEEFTKRTCIRFVYRSSVSITDYVEYTSDKDQCSSNVGRTGGHQTIILGRHCDVIGTFIHETMHALGMVHEHSRADRDQHIKIVWDNVKKTEWSNFQKYKMDHLDNLAVPYNFASLMHYRPNAFTKNGKDTIIAIDNVDLEFGQREKFSIGDVKEINNLYNCNMEHKNIYNDLFLDYNGKK